MMHKLNTCVQWATGLAGTTGSGERTGTIKNPEMRDLIGRVSGCVGFFSHSTCSNDKMRLIQSEICGDGGNLNDPLNFVRRNDTR
jgi:hypothetical protein